MKAPKALPSSHLYQFGDFELIPDELQLLRHGKPVPLTPKVYETLLVLVENSGHVMSKDELMERVWSDTIVEESNLAQNISTLRKALNDDHQQFIQTVPKHGYRFVAEVSVLSHRSDEPLPEYLDAEIVENPEHNKLIVTESDSLVAAKPHKLLPYQLTMAMMFIVGPLAIAWFIFLRQPPPKAVPSTLSRQLAVLPFRNLKQEANTDFIGFSLADSIITKLGYVNSLSVRPSSYIEKFRQQDFDPRQVAVDLNVNTLLTGTYLREGDELRITAQLIDVITNEILWKEALDLKYVNLISVQDKVAQQVIRGLNLNLTSAENERFRRDSPTNAEAYEYYLRGVDLYASNEFKLAAQMLEQSIKLDANYAQAWAHLGRAHTAQASFDFGGEEFYKKAQSDYEKALTLNKDFIEARIFMANLFTDTGRPEEAVPLLRQAITDNPNSAEAHWELGYAYRFAGLLKESIAAGETARRLDSTVKLNSSAFNSYFYEGQYEQFLSSLPMKHSLGFIVFYRGLGNYYLKRYDEAAKDFELAYKNDPKSMYVQIGQALRLKILQQNAEGLRLLREIEKQIESRKVTDAEAIYKVAQGFAELGDSKAALRLLKRSIEGGFFCYPYFVNDPLLNNLRGEPELEKVLSLAQQRHEAFKRKFFPV